MSTLRNHSLSLFFLVIFIAALVGQAIAGHAEYNNDEIAHARLLNEEPETLSFWRYVVTSNFGQAVMENWQSEYLQFFLFIFATVWLIQRGSTESKKPGEEGPESDKEQRIGRHANEDSPRWARTGGWRTAVFSRSLGLLMGALFLLTWLASSFAGWAAFNSEQLGDKLDPVSWAGYLGGADFWNRSFQNWQSEMLAVGSMAIFSVYLRQRGSPESKPVGVAHAETGQTG